MTSGSDMPADQGPLTAEERALAQRLARLGPHGEPSPALDARILAAAHAAGSQARPWRQRQRWPLALGVAASLALAVGVAWRLRPLPEPAPAYRSQTVSAAKAVPAPAADAQGVLEAETATDDNAAHAAPAPPPPVAARQAPVEPLLQPEAFPHAARQALPAPTPPEEPSVYDAPAPGASPAPVAPPATSAAATGAASPVRNAQSDAAAAEAIDTAGRAGQSRERSAVKPADIPADALAAEEDVPPATADAPEVRDAWLQRIRELVAAGKLDDARASLREFTRRWPDYPLPADLRALGP